MKLCTDTVTVFTSRVNPETRSPEYVPTVLDGVSWYATEAETVDAKGGLIAAHKVVVRIPAEVLPAGLVIRGGDILVRGDASAMEPRPAALKAAFPDYMTVLAVTDNRRAPNAPHLKVTGA